MVKIGLIGGLRIGLNCSNRAGHTGKRLLGGPRKTLSEEEQPGGEESEGEHAEAFQAPEFEHVGIIMYPNMWLRALTVERPLTPVLFNLLC